MKNLMIDTEKVRGATWPQLFISTLRDAAINDILSLYAVDQNGWAPIHEAARGGQTHVVTFLVQEAERSGVTSNTFTVRHC